MICKQSTNNKLKGGHIMNRNEIASLSVIKVSLSIGQWDGSVYDKKVTRETNNSNNATEDAGRYQKFLVAREAIKAFQKISNQIRLFNYDNTIPFNNNGDFTMSEPHYREVYKPTMDGLIEKWWAAVNEFKSNYETFKNESQNRLGKMFKESDYPEIEALDKRFHIDVIYSRMILNVSEEMKQELIDKVQSESMRVFRSACGEIWDRMYNVVSHMVEKLKTTDTIFRDSLINNVKELCQTLKTLNFTGDPEIEAMRVRVESALTGYSPEELRNSRKVRATAFDTAQTILSEIDAGRRRIRFTE
jgi:hypothetical protein